MRRVHAEMSACCSRHRLLLLPSGARPVVFLRGCPDSRLGSHSAVVMVNRGPLSSEMDTRLDQVHWWREEPLSSVHRCSYTVRKMGDPCTWVWLQLR